MNECYVSRAKSIMGKNGEEVGWGGGCERRGLLCRDGEVEDGERLENSHEYAELSLYASLCCY